MTDPRTPRTKDAQLPDPLDQTPAGERPEAALQPRGSEDAQLLAEAEAGETDVEQESVRTND
jgi:hypothetical protein